MAKQPMNTNVVFLHAGDFFPAYKTIFIFIFLWIVIMTD